MRDGADLLRNLELFANVNGSIRINAINRARVASAATASSARYKRYKYDQNTATL